MRTTDKRHVRDLARICAAKGLRHVVLSPGSRCAPLVIAFHRQDGIDCLSINDERSAAFYALGMAQQLREPVGLVCTSGSAILNYAPALAEAFYQGVPLMVFTADRPNEWIDQGENQSIRQDDIYRNYIKRSFSLPVSFEGEKDAWYSARMVSEALNESVRAVPGPVHVNVPLREPLYDLAEDDGAWPKTIDVVPTEAVIPDRVMNRLLRSWHDAARIWVIAGWHDPDPDLEASLQALTRDPRVVLWTEATANLHVPNQIDRMDPVIEWIAARSDEDRWLPDLVVTFGGGIVSKKLKFLLRNRFDGQHWHLSPDARHWDKFQSLSQVVPTDPARLFYNLLEDKEVHSSDYQKNVIGIQAGIDRMSATRIADLDHQDHTVFAQVLHALPPEAVLQAGNSTPIRYVNLFSLSHRPDVTVHANRGVSGIDGQVSTAAGAAHVTDRPVLSVTGDIGFLYDSNALWNTHLSPNLRIVVIDNGGGNIFRIIPGPDRLDELESSFETPQNVDLEQLVTAFGHAVRSADDPASTAEGLDWLMAPSETVRVLVVTTPGEVSAAGLRDYFRLIRELDIR